MIELSRPKIIETVKQASLVTAQIVAPVLAFKETIKLGYSVTYGHELTLSDPRVGRIVAGLATFAIAGLAYNQTGIDQE